MKATYEINHAGTSRHFTTLRLARLAKRERFANVNIWKIQNGIATLVR